MTTRLLQLTLALALVLTITTARAEPTTYRSGPARTHLLELYTSEGCHSCPPGEAWLARLAHDPRLWTEVVPVAFHVDYWDYLGWKDALASPRFSARQRRYASSWGSGRVYTPGFVLDGNEWRGFFRREELSLQPGESGNLEVVVEEDEVRVRFDPLDDFLSASVNVALLGFGIEQPVARGENRGKTLTHDFVVLSHEVREMESDAAGFRSTLTLGRSEVDAKSHAVAVWITREGELLPIQATGGWLVR